MGEPAQGMTRRRAVAGGVLVVLGASAAAWAVAVPHPPGAGLPATVVRALADCSAVVTLGLTVAPMLDTSRHRSELMKQAAAPLASAAALWLLAELSRLVLGAAEAAAVPVSTLGVAEAWQFAYATSVGRSGLFSIAAAGLVAAMTLGLPRSTPAVTATAGVAAVGLVARTIGGHLSMSSPGAVAIAVHALAAALWCGTLAALALVVEHRGQWARVLPRFSQLALACVIALLVGGIAGALVTVDSPTQLFATGYGRVLLIKIALTVLLLALAWRNRAQWLPAAKAHRVTAEVSRSRSLIELAIMLVALTMAAALSVTG